MQVISKMSKSWYRRLSVWPVPGALLLPVRGKERRQETKSK